ncbi:SMC-Scp complex subunit ScpB [Pseudogracilibacillus auburnensis]|uniref:SMC-Scp complex subunit ScpB n=1 Tax=Pseudogracilibacillus auburnensis TaxID=1494959 RepID=UPI001A9716C2|nr:SMC-Scp complex subunit ScpB [Pseudogracilibacillus auburnensis]MBO1003088.1 SMC-Scp complex subunit ScpB [Pseudogracilibacillus auburnensis]
MTIKYKGIVEGLLFASGDEGITMNQIAKVVDVSPETVKHLIEELTFDYEHINRGMSIIQSNEIYHLTTKPEHNEYYKKLLQHPRTTRMSQATLETLAIIAYEQPITRVEIEEIRGVNSDYAVQTLLARSLIENVGRKESIGRPILFGTSKEFLTYFGLSSIDELPPLPNEIDKESAEKEADLFFRQLTDETDEA